MTQNSDTERQGTSESAETVWLHDVFVSYASQNAETASALVAALERHGLKCWIAPRDVEPGAPYADVIIRAINNAKVVALVLSQNAAASAHVGREVERAAAKHRPIIVVRTDTTALTPALEYFLSASQWIDAHAEGIDTAAEKLRRAVQRLGASPAGSSSSAAAAPSAGRVAAGAGTQRTLIAAVVVVAVLAIAGLIYWLSRSRALQVAAAPPPPTSSVSASAVKEAGPPAHSIAVLPFVNMSGDPKQDYFSDGLSEELLNSLAAIPDLQVAARTSSFSFKGKNTDVADIGRKLNVGAVLEGSVRKDGNEVRITAQLVNALTGFHLWSHTYDRDLKNVLALQTEIATAVTKALQATLMAGAATSIELGGTQNPDALDAYLRGKNLYRLYYDKAHAQESVAAFLEAIRIDPQFAKAYVGAANMQNVYANNFTTGGDDERSWFKQARTNAEKAVALAPELGEAHAAVAEVLSRGSLDFAHAESEYERALQLSPSDVDVLLQSGVYFVTKGRAEAGIGNIRKAIALDQLNPGAYTRLALALQYAHRYREAIEASNRALQLNPNDDGSNKNLRGWAQLLSGELDASRQSCDTTPRTWIGHLCMAILYDKFHQHHDAEAELAAMKAELGDSASYQYAEIYAQWGDIPQALNWLEIAYRLPDPGIGTLETDELINPLRKEPRFQAIERKLNFSNFPK
jgi:TolB-like protein/Flp pilus assembly protein TadD